MKLDISEIVNALDYMTVDELSDLRDRIAMAMLIKKIRELRDKKKTKNIVPEEILKT